MRRFSSTVISGNSRRPSGQRLTPALTIRGGDSWSRRRSPNSTVPAVIGTSPITALRIVLLPAPFAPTIETISRSSTDSVTPRSARTFP